jgi:hypothetical protein
LPQNVRERLGITKNPLEDVYAHVRVLRRFNYLMLIVG